MSKLIVFKIDRKRNQVKAKKKPISNCKSKALTIGDIIGKDIEKIFNK